MADKPELSAKDQRTVRITLVVVLVALAVGAFAIGSPVAAIAPVFMLVVVLATNAFGGDGGRKSRR